MIVFILFLWESRGLIQKWIGNALYRVEVLRKYNKNHVMHGQLWPACAKNRSLSSESMVNLWSGLFCNAFMINNLAHMERSTGIENSHYINNKVTLIMLFIVSFLLMW